MTLYQIELLISVADTGSISGAAEAWDLTQPTVSYQLQMLEQELSVALLRRKGRGMELTDAGRLVVEDGRKLVRLARAIPNRVSAADRIVEGDVTLGLSPVSPVSTHHFPTIYRKFHDTYPDVRVTLVEEASAEMVTSLQNHRIDLAIMSLPLLGGRVNIERLWDEELVVVGNPALNPSRPLKLSALSQEPWVIFRPGFGLARAVVSLCQTHGFDPQRTAEVSTMGAVVGFVAAGLGISMIPREVAIEEEAMQRVKILPLDMPVFRTMALVTPQESLGPTTKALSRTIRDYSKALGSRQ